MLLNKLFTSYNRKLLRDLAAAKQDPWPQQLAAFAGLLQHGATTSFGKEHNLAPTMSVADFQKKVPLRDYDRLEPYIRRMLQGEDHVLWDKNIPWFALSSGTSSSKSKFIPISPDGLKNCHMRGMQTLVAQYISTHPESRMLSGKTLTLGGSRHIDSSVKTRQKYGDLSAFLIRKQPWLAGFKSTPGKLIALIPDFARKIDLISQIIPHQRVTAFAGVPSWNLLLMQKILKDSGKKHLHEIWPHMELFIHGGTSFDPYRQTFKRLFPDPKMHYIEAYNASEGFFAFQDATPKDGMLLLPNCGVFYEFIPFQRLNDAIQGTYTHFMTMENVQLHQNYAMVISTNSGLWRYLVGDTVKFVSLNPHRIVITGRIQAYINTFGEELMVRTAENALAETCTATGASVYEFTVAPIFMDENRKGGHQWVVEFEKEPADMAAFAAALDSALCAHNSDYAAKRLETNTMNPLLLTPVPKGTFYKWMQNRSKLGGQNKVPRLSPERNYVETLIAHLPA